MKDKRLKPCPMCGNESLDIHGAYQCYSMKMYSSRKAKKIKEILEDSDSAES